MCDSTHISIIAFAQVLSQSLDEIVLFPQDTVTIFQECRHAFRADNTDKQQLNVVATLE